MKSYRSHFILKEITGIKGIYLDNAFKSMESSKKYAVQYNGY